MKKAVNHVFFWLIVYNLICTIFTKAIPSASLSWMFLSGVILGNAVLLLVSRKKWKIPKRECRPMTCGSFFSICCLLCLLQGISGIIHILLYAIGIKGTSIDINMSQLGVVFILYAALIGPVAEELAYRRFVIGNLEKYGAIPAIIISSLAFGLMHGNLQQSLFAFFTGLVLGYVYLEFGLIWSCIFHIANNFCFAILPGLLTNNTNAANMAVTFIVIIGSIAGVIILIKKRSDIKTWFRRDDLRGEIGCTKKLLSSVWFWIFCLIFILVIVLFMVFPEVLEKVSATIQTA